MFRNKLFSFYRTCGVLIRSMLIKIAILNLMNLTQVRQMLAKSQCISFVVKLPPA